jgi:uncharacterized protein YcfJ
MKTTKLTTVLLGSVSLVLLAGCNEESQVAQAGSGKTAREVCTEQTVTRQKPVKDDNRVIGTVAGAVVGGVIGNEVGGKGTKGDSATVGGAVAGGYAGNRVQKSVQDNATEETTEVVCKTVYE